MSDDDKLPPPGLLALGSDESGELTTTDSDGKTEPLFPPGVRDKISAALDDMNVSVQENGIDVHLCGACPMQGEGTVDGLPVYFRSRGESWRLGIAAEVGGDPVEAGFDGDPGWVLGAEYGQWPDAGWICGAHTRQCLMAAVESWRAAGGPKAPQGEVPLDPRWPVPAGPVVDSEEAP